MAIFLHRASSVKILQQGECLTPHTSGARVGHVMMSTEGVQSLVCISSGGSRAPDTSSLTCCLQCELIQHPMRRKYK